MRFADMPLSQKVIVPITLQFCAYAALDVIRAMATSKDRMTPPVVIPIVIPFARGKPADQPAGVPCSAPVSVGDKRSMALNAAMFCRGLTARR
jgi:hypothetical protein